MINESQLDSGRIQSNLRETNKGYYYANRVDTTRDRDNLNMLSHAFSNVGKIATREGKKYDESQYNKAIVDSAQMSTAKLGEALRNDDNSNSYRRGLRKISMHRSLLNIQQQVAAKSQSLVDQNLTAPEIQSQLTAYGTKLMNADPNLKNFDPNEVAGTFYAPLLSSIGNQVAEYSKQSAANMKDKAYQELGSVTESAITGDIHNQALNSEQTSESMVTHLNNLVQQSESANFSPDEVNAKVMQTSLAVALKTGDLRVLKSLDIAKLHGKAISSYPENAIRISEATAQIKAHIKAAHAQAMADHQKGEQAYLDGLSAQGYKDMFHNPNGDQSAIQSQLAASGNWKAIAAYNRGANAARSMKNNERTDRNQQVQLGMIKNILTNSRTYSTAEIMDTVIQNHMTQQQANVLLSANDPKGLRDVLNGNPSIGLGFKRLSGLITMPKDGMAMNSAKNAQVQEAIGNLGVMIQGYADKHSGQIAPDDIRTINNEINHTIKELTSTTPQQEQEAGQPITQKSQPTQPQSSFGRNEGVVDANLKKGVPPEVLAKAIAEKAGYGDDVAKIKKLTEEINARQQQLSGSTS